DRFASIRRRVGIKVLVPSFTRKHAFVTERDQNLQVLRIVGEDLLRHAIGLGKIFLREAAEQLLLAIGLFCGYSERVLVIFVSFDPDSQVSRVLIVLFAIFPHIGLGCLIGDSGIRFAIVEKFLVGRDFIFVVGFLHRRRSTRL